MISTELVKKPDEIREQASRILASSMFKKSKILSNFLNYIVHETINGNEQQLKEYIIAVNVLKKKSDFNPQLDAIVRIHARRLRQLLIDYYKSDGRNDPIFISVPKGRYIPHFKINNSKRPLKKTIQKPIVEKVESIPVIAVLPFQNFQKNVKSDVICSILSHDLSIELSHFPEIGVISNYSTQFAQETISDMGNIISNLGVDYLITGSCILEGEKAKINIELSNCLDKKVLWAEKYNCDDIENNSFHSYDKVIRKVVAIVCGFFGLIYRITLNEHVPNDYDQLYAIYWHNRYHRQYTEEAFHESLKAVELGLKKNPDNPLLTAFKGELYLNLITMDIEGEIDFLKYGTSLVKHAISIDPNNQHAYQVKAWANILSHNKTELYHSMEKCIAINPNNASYVGQMGFGYICAGDYEKGLELMSESVQLNPYFNWNLNIGFCLYFMHNEEFEEAFHWAEKINRRGVFWDPLFRASTLGFLNRKEEANKAYKELLLLSPAFPEKAKKLVNLFILDKRLQEQILRGLALAGMK
jgi:TolB-like protein